ncbi:MAG: type II toxin-antitoxin system Phd/YefM family antitoxin [Acidobacteriota bacterium]|nr:type II toxin-antitoxin system Phd/YefM family antitoxin [Acidobacteriota bacterium]
MKFVTVRDLRGRSAKVWKDLKTEKDLILTSNGKPMAIITGVGEESLESTLAALRRDRAVRAVREIQRDSVRRFPKGMSLREINAEIKAVRAKRPR